MKKKLLLIICLGLCLQMIGCTNNKNGSVVDTKTVVWRIAALGNYKDLTDELIKLWQEPLNELLKEKKSPYQVKIIPFSNEEENKQIEDLKELQKKGEQTDVITLLPEVGGDELASWRNTYKYAVDNDLLMNLDEWKEKNKKELEKVLTSYDFELAKINNKLFGISSIVPTTAGVEYSKELLNKYSIDVKEIKNSIFDNTNLLTQVKNKSNDTPIKFLGLSAALTGLWIVPTTQNLAWKKGEGFISLSKSIEYKNLLEQAISFKQQGLFDQTAIDQFTFPFVTMSRAPISKRDTFEISIEDTSTKNEIIVVPNQKVPNMELYWGDNKTSIASWSENNENAQDFLLKLFTDKDIANLLQYGIEGQDYQLDDEQHIIVNSENLGLKIFGYQFTNPKITYSSVYEEDDKVAYSQWFYEKYGENFPKGFRFNPNSVLTDISETNKIISADFTNLSDSEWMNKIRTLNIEDLDTFLNDLNNELDKAGMQKVVNEANRQYQEFLKETK